MHFGPFIAIGSPTETLPIPGAARARLSDSEWQARVTNWIYESSLIVMYCGKTHWVNWELKRITESGRIQHVILMMPQIKATKPRLKADDISLRIDRIREVVKDTPWTESISAIREYRDVGAMLFSGNGLMTVIRCRHNNRESAHLAALVGHYVLINEPHISAGKSKERDGLVVPEHI
jgi:hypothetical protein